jgi:hypothetical protein
MSKRNETSFLAEEGGILLNKSCNNSVRQYNASKPDKYRIDFFVLVNASKGKNFIYHLYVYQGKNATNAHIIQEAWHLPTTQKAVANAVVSSGINNDPDGMCELHMDNCSPLLSYLFYYMRSTIFLPIVLFIPIVRVGIAIL